VLVQLSAGGSNSANNTFLAGGQVGRHAGQQPRPTAAEQADTVETDV